MIREVRHMKFSGDRRCGNPNTDNETDAGNVTQK